MLSDFRFLIRNNRLPFQCSVAYVIPRRIHARPKIGSCDQLIGTGPSPRLRASTHDRIRREMKWLKVAFEDPVV
jgi:hypothetical protein